MMTPVPLVRPSFPATPRWLPRWERSTRATNHYSNMGPLWQEAAKQLSYLTGRNAIPVSTGTAAVELAMYAAWEQGKGTGGEPSVEPFTFEATRCAAANVYAATSHLGFVGVRTVPFGCHRDLTGAVGAVDAAGAFGPGMRLPEDAAVAVSFHATKNFPIGEGGAVLLPKNWHFGKNMCQHASNFGFDESRVRRTAYATNAKLDELRCAVLLAQLERISYFEDRCSRIREQSLALADTQHTYLPYHPGDWQSLVVVGVAEKQDDFTAFLAANGYMARRVYWPAPSHIARQYSTDQKAMVALPSDMSGGEFRKLRALVRSGEWLR